MKQPSRIIRVVATIGMLLGMLVVAAPVATAQAPTAPGVNPGDSSLLFSIDGAQEVYFPWVGNDDDFGLGGADSAVTLQNLTDFDGYLFIYTGNGTGYDLATSAFLAAGASKTFSADDLGIESPGTSVIAGLYDTVTVDDTGEICEWEIGQDVNDDGDLDDCFEYPTESTLYVPLALAGVTKSAVEGGTLPLTSTDDSAVSGYNGLSGMEIGDYEAHYLPIVQTNCGPGGCWDTRITVSNFRTDLNAAVTIRFFPADDGSGSLKTGFQVQTLLNPGDSYQVLLSDLVPEGWVGSAHVLNDDNIGVIADRFKVGTDMWLTNIGSNQTAEWDLQDDDLGLVLGSANYVLFAPAVYLDYNGWNTGVSVANLVEEDNNINIQYYVNAGNAPSVQTQRLAAHGMTYFYNPSDPPEDGTGQSVDMDRLAAMLVLSDFPVAAAVDAVKYFGNDQNVGQAMTYNASGNIWAQQAMPLVQKGSASTGMGATSGLHLFNPLPIQNVIAVYWLNQSGWDADNFGTTTVVVPGEALGFAYTMNQHNLPNGYWGSAYALSNLDLPFGMTSANVDYQVQGDGSTIWNGYNPCGLFRQSPVGDDIDQICSFFGEDLGFFTKTVEFDSAPAEGIMVELYETDDALECDLDSLIDSPLTDENGEAVFTVAGNDSYCLIMNDSLGNPIGDPEIIEIPDGEFALTNDITDQVAAIDATLTVTPDDPASIVELESISLSLAAAGDTDVACETLPLATIDGTDAQFIFVADGVAEYCVQGTASIAGTVLTDAETDILPTNGTTTPVALAVTDVPVLSYLDVLVTLDGTPEANIPVYIQFQFAGGCSATTFYQTATSDVTGMASFELLPGDFPSNWQVCGDPNGDGTLTQLFPVTIDLGDPVDAANAPDATLAETTPAP